jgi:hypothetical protein
MQWRGRYHNWTCCGAGFQSDPKTEIAFPAFWVRSSPESGNCKRAIAGNYQNRPPRFIDINQRAVEARVATIQNRCRSKLAIAILAARVRSPTQVKKTDIRQSPRCQRPRRTRACLLVTRPPADCCESLSRCKAQASPSEARPSSTIPRPPDAIHGLKPKLYSASYFVIVTLM